MSGEELQVDPQDLHGKAAQIDALSWPSQAAQAPLISADALVIASVAVTNLSINAEALWAHQEYGRQEGARLAQTLRNVGDAYAQIDQMSGEDIGASLDGPLSPGGPGATVYPRAVDLPAPAPPAAMPIPKGQLASDQGLIFVPEVQRALHAGDHGESLRGAATVWRTNGQALAASAEKFKLNSLDWEGEAADAAYAKFNAYRDWLINLGESWNNLADEAERIAGEHDKARDAHQPIAEEYQQLEAEVMGKPLTPESMVKMERMAELQTDSEEVRNSYARGAQTNQVQPASPPTPVLSGVPVTAEDHRRARANTAGSSERQAGAGGGRPTGAGESAAQSLPQEAPVSPISAAEQAGQGAAQGASPGGGSPGGGQGGSQGGSPGGGAPGGAPSGVPGLGKGEPRLPTDPTLRPAAAGGGSGGGGVGGGMGPSPLQPAVGAETVAPTPVAAPGAPTAASGGTSGGGIAGGGMGGMAPMMGGARGGESGDKKRNPQLSKDEEIYTEERPHTEPVVGHRARRRGAPDDSKRESQ